MEPPRREPERALTHEEEVALRNSCWFHAAICQSDHFLVAKYTRLRVWLYVRGEFMSERCLHRIHVMLEVLQSNFTLRGMTVTVNVGTVTPEELTRLFI